MRKIIEASGKRTTYFELSMSDDNKTLKMVDLNGNFTDLTKDDVDELIKALSSFKNKFK